MAAGLVSLLKKLNRTLGFTPTESKVALFLVGTFLIGVGIRWYRSNVAPQPRFDYSALDAEFKALSEAQPEADDDSTTRQRDSFGSPRKARRSAPTTNVLTANSIDINVATKTELMKLPGVGETTAEHILLYRRQHGPFTSVEGLLNVKGIGKVKLAKIAPYCKVGR